ncbi:MAG: hypothetical protein K8E24_012280, partial [Methanobacterium paludis]|nr:hypothetical protein [Methanobacterium paludis]
QIDHANVVSIAQFSDDELRTARELLVGRTGCRYPWVNVGIETASGALLKANGGGAKIGPHGAGAWAEHCAEQVRRLCRAGFFPLTSLMLGLPGETEEDVRSTLAWVRSMEGERVSVFPMLVAPVDGSPIPRMRDLTKTQWDLIKASYQLNFRWTPRMYWDNQAAAGVSLSRRLLLQTLGWAEVAEWRTLFALRSARARRSK